MMASMKSLFFVLALSVGTLLLGCMSREIHEQDLVGKYRANLPGDTVEFLELRPSGECVQEIRLKDGVSRTAHGKWRYDSKLKCLYLEGTRIALTPEGKINPDIERILPGNTGALSVSRSVLGRVTIMLNESVDYEKQ